jgi:DNA-binding response OmpR family regulator
MSTRLLVHVDDDENWGFLLQRALLKSGLQGWSHQYLTSGNSALDYLIKVTRREAEPPHLIALDVRMPGVSGLQILEWASTHLPDTPVVMLTSSDLLADRLAARNLGSKGYFTKEPLFSDFIEFLRNWNDTAFAAKPASTPNVTQDAGPNIDPLVVPPQRWFPRWASLGG